MSMKHALGLFNVVKDWRLLVEMIKDKGYKIPLFRKLIYAVLLFGIILPVDFVLNFVPFVDIVDDLGTFTVILGIILYEISNYRDFREQKDRERRASRTDTV